MQTNFQIDIFSLILYASTFCKSTCDLDLRIFKLYGIVMILKNIDKSMLTKIQRQFETDTLFQKTKNKQKIYDI